MGMDLFCLIGIVLSFAAFVSMQCRNFIFFLVMWLMYLSVFHVSFGILFSLLYCSYCVPTSSSKNYLSVRVSIQKTSTDFQ